MKKGVVMSVKGKRTILYTEQGDFIKITTPARVPLVGQAIGYTPPTSLCYRFHNLFKYATTAAALFLILALGLAYPLFWPLGGAVAAVELNINDGVSLQVDKKGKVTAVHSAKSGAEQPVEQLPVEGLDVYQAVQMIVEEAGVRGNFSHEDGVVMVSVVPVAKNGADVVDAEKLKHVVHDQMLKQNAGGVVVVGKSSASARSEAQNLGMSVTNYVVYERCLQGGVEVDAEVFRGKSVREAMAEANVSLPSLFPGEYLEVRGYGDNNGHHKGWSKGNQKVGHVEGKKVKEDVIVYSTTREQDFADQGQELKRFNPAGRNSAARLNSRQVTVYSNEEPANSVRVTEWNVSSGSAVHRNQQASFKAKENKLPSPKTGVRNLQPEDRHGIQILSSPQRGATYDNRNIKNSSGQSGRLVQPVNTQRHGSSKQEQTYRDGWNNAEHRAKNNVTGHKNHDSKQLLKLTNGNPK